MCLLLHAEGWGCAKVLEVDVGTVVARLLSWSIGTGALVIYACLSHTCLWHIYTGIYDAFMQYLSWSGLSIKVKITSPSLPHIQVGPIFLVEPIDSLTQPAQIMGWMSWSWASPVQYATLWTMHNIQSVQHVFWRLVTIHRFKSFLRTGY